MKLPEESGNYNDKDKIRSLPVAYAIVGVSLVVLLILITVIAQNRGNNPAPRPTATPLPTEAPDPGFGIGANNSNSPGVSDNALRPGDLDFWDMYPKGDGTGLDNTEVDPQDPVESPTPGPAEDGRHTLVERRDGTSEWVRINPYITRNVYDPLGFIMKNDRMGYYENDRLVSQFGIDLSRQNGEVNFARVKSAGVDFVMLRLGARGYETGQITIDDNFHQNLNGALDNNLHVGIYFFSQAINTTEAIEEANLIIEALVDRRIAYPVVFQMEYVAYDAARIDGLSKDEKTEIAMTFCNYLSGAGYVPMIYGTKEWLIEQIDMTKLMAYDIWLSQPGDLPDYPYKYQIWQYSHNGAIAGVGGDVSLNVSFVDYTAR
ncbi:MAG: glycoside hydrolase family 25 protein [Lachnospiraceae bacterium]|jgi:GH25 family lysozyme M1 (1,4-beta-N-acetylmuramidase)|nr:glycoside hydrolase family 25 protein [Lachnospiraceae bacterium]